MGLVSSLPDEWKTSITVLRGGGRDPRGNPLPAEEIQVTDCLFADRTTQEQMGFTDLVDADAVIYRDPDPTFSFLPRDRIVIPDGARGAGEWSISGRTQEWPYGIVVPLKF